MNEMHNYFRECVADIEGAIPAKWENTSFHHDAAPSYQFNGWHIWVMHHKKAKRDIEFENYARFCVVPVDCEGCFIEGASSFDCEDFGDVLTIVATKHKWGV